MKQTMLRTYQGIIESFGGTMPIVRPEPAKRNRPLNGRRLMATLNPPRYVEVPKKLRTQKGAIPIEADGELVEYNWKRLRRNLMPIRSHRQAKRARMAELRKRKQPAIRLTHIRRRVPPGIPRGAYRRWLIEWAKPWPYHRKAVL